LDSIFMHSDGVPDAVLKTGQRVGVFHLRTKLAEFLQTHRTPTLIIQALRKSLINDGVTFTDDLTMMMVTRPDTAARVNRLELRFELGEIDRLRRATHETALLQRFSETDASLLAVAAVEVFTNVIRHGQGVIPQAPIELFIEQKVDAIEIELKYLGDRFEPSPKKVLPDLETFPEGGFGMSIIDDVCDSVHYGHSNGVNSVRLYKTRPVQAAFPLQA
jgi:anti-sigma regulatory factor (Ser/Thr protein kinase)